ncbi:MAG: hypothetical protein IPH76_18510 [Xanthomonadales bacterium]|nr:hypothetical protein [Xanthomonadales bacterium]
MKAFPLGSTLVATRLSIRKKVEIENAVPAMSVSWIADDDAFPAAKPTPATLTPIAFS